MKLYGIYLNLQILYDYTKNQCAVKPKITKTMLVTEKVYTLLRYLQLAHGNASRRIWIIRNLLKGVEMAGAAWCTRRGNNAVFEIFNRDGGQLI